MANTQSNKPYYEKATINTVPPTAGYWTRPVSARGKGVNRLFLSVSETGDSSAFTATVTLQFKAPGDDDWQVYGTYTTATREIIEDHGKCDWRAGVDNGDYTSGEVSVTIDW